MIITGNIYGSQGGATMGLETADNGLTANTATNVQLGGALIHDTIVDLGTGGKLYLRDVTGNSAYMNLLANVGAPDAILGIGHAGAVNELDFSIVKALFTDTVNHKGPEGAEDFSANYTSLSYIQKVYADAAYTPVVTGVDNGLSLSGPVAELGCLLTKNTLIDLHNGGSKYSFQVIDTASETIDFELNASSSAPSLNMWLVHAGFQIGISALPAGPGGGGLELFAESGGGAQYVYISGDHAFNSFRVGDTLNSQGMVYDGDYEANFSGRSLITKQYLQSQLSLNAQIVDSDKVVGVMASGNLMTYPNAGSGDNTYRLNANVLLRAVTAGTVQVTCSYTDEASNAQTFSFSSVAVAGTATSDGPKVFNAKNGIVISVDVVITGTGVIADCYTFLERLG
jgi:hypothetical protein